MLFLFKKWSRILMSKMHGRVQRSRARNTIGRTLFLWMGLVALPETAAQLPPLPFYPGLRLVYEDDFNTFNEAVFTKLDGYVQTPWDIACYRADDAYTEYGNLVLRTRRRDTVCNGKPYQYTSGWVDTVGKLELPAAGGLVEIRSKLPFPSFRIWPAGWLISRENKRDMGLCWPLSTEIDVYEVAGGYSTPSGTSDLCASYHWGTQCFVDLGQARTGCLPSGQLLFWERWHTYSARWTESSIQWYVDGVPLHVMDRVSDPNIALPVPHAMILILNTALAWWISPQGTPPGIGDGETFHYIDWVRLWAPI